MMKLGRRTYRLYMLLHLIGKKLEEKRIIKNAPSLGVYKLKTIVLIKDERVVEERLDGVGENVSFRKISVEGFDNWFRF